MAIYKCKMCGGTLEINNETVATCDYCGTQQTVPNVMDENLQGLFNRANILRMKSEFDKAEQIYEKIIQADNTQAEAYWGLILCKYGIEYVEDPKTYQRIPTCHRTSYDSIIADDDYQSALQYADGLQRGIYEAEAKEIDRLQKEILTLSQQEEPYDVFICYKETDQTGSRTIDSTIANDIYYQLTNAGYKVFYAAISLEDKLGSAYEPCIFAALNSAKVMLVVGTKLEYFNAVWVKNEWSRFLKMMKNDRSKILIPCYKDMDAYELPEEFAHLQAQDMSKIGFVNDVVRGIQKVVVKEEAAPAKTVVESVVTTSTTNDEERLLKRVYAFLEDDEWEKADEYIEKALDINVDNPDALLCKVLVEFECCDLEFLAYCVACKTFNMGEIEVNKHYRRFCRVASEEKRREVDAVFENEAKAFATQQREVEEYANKFIPQLEAKRKELAKFQGRIYCDDKYVLGVRVDGVCLSTAEGMRDECNVSHWKNIRSISSGISCTIGITYDNTCVTTNKKIASEVAGWKNIQKVFVSHPYIIAIKTNGRCIATSLEEYNSPPFSLYEWVDIVDAVCKDEYAVGLKSNGTCVVAGNCDCEVRKRIESWTDIVQLSTSVSSVIALKKNGLVYEGDNELKTDVDNYKPCVFLTNSWGEMYLKEYDEEFGNQDIVAVSGISYLVAIKEDGTIAVNDSSFKSLMQREKEDEDYDPEYAIYSDCDQQKAQKWRLFQSAATFDQEREEILAAKVATQQAALEKEYQEAINVMQIQKDYLQAKSAFEAILHYKDAKELAQQCKELHLQEQNEKIQLVKKIREINKPFQNVFISQEYKDSPHFFADYMGKVYSTFSNELTGDTSLWNNISVCLSRQAHVVGLRHNGTVVATGDNQYGQCNTGNWNNIVSIGVGKFHTVGLKNDGTVVAVGDNNFTQCNVSSWKNIKKVVANLATTFGLTIDGRVEVVGSDRYHQHRVKDWNNIANIFALEGCVVGLKTDGTVVSTKDEYDFSGWTDIIAIAIDFDCVYGLKNDGTVVVTGKDEVLEKCKDVTNWTNIVAISTRNAHVVGLKTDGTVLATGLDLNNQCDVSGWRNVVAIATGHFCTLALCEDGSVCFTGAYNGGPTLNTIPNLFPCADTFEEDRKAFAAKSFEYQSKGLCQYCGGTFKGLFTKKCVNCGKPKDYN